MNNHFAFILAFALIFNISISISAQAVGIKKTSVNTDAQAPSKDGIDLVIESNPEAAPVGTKGLIPIIDGTHGTTIASDCLPQKMEDEMYAKKSKGLAWSAELKKYFERCGSRLKENRPEGLWALAMFGLTKYDFEKNTSFQPIFAETSDGVQTFGYLGIKKDPTPRPLLIIKCGLYCSGEPSTSTRNYLMHFFDESPFHVMLLANYSAPEHISHNKELVFGGYQEAVGLIELADWMKNGSSFKNKISDTHLVGISLGGHAALYASYYNDRVREKTGIAPLSSVMAICPVVKLESTIKGLFKNENIIGKITSLETWTNMRKVHPYLPEAQDLYSPDDKPNYDQLPDTMATAAYRYLTHKSFPEYVPGHVNSKEDFWKLNTYTGYAKSLKTPTLVFTADDDMLVNTPLNTGSLVTELKNADNPNVFIHSIPEGNHCAFAGTYGHDFMTRMIRSYIVNHSPVFGKSQVPKYSKAIFPKLNIGYRETNVMQKWKVEPNSQYAELTFVIHGPYDASCSRKPYGGSHFCQREEKLKIPLNQMPFPLTSPTNEADAQSLTRRLNASFEIMTTSGRLTGTTDEPKTIKWYPQWFTK